MSRGLWSADLLAIQKRRIETQCEPVHLTARGSQVKREYGGDVAAAAAAVRVLDYPHLTPPRFVARVFIGLLSDSLLAG